MDSVVLYVPIVGRDVDGSKTQRSIIPYGYSAYPEETTMPTLTVSASAEVLWTQAAGGDPALDNAYLKASWTSEASAGRVTKGLQFGVGAVCGNCGTAYTSAEVGALVKVNQRDRFKEFKLGIFDPTGTESPEWGTDTLSADNTWELLSHSPITISGWPSEANLRAFFVARGTDDDDDVGLTEVYINYLYIRFMS
jgi:hypothetical protein